MPCVTDTGETAADGVSGQRGNKKRKKGQKQTRPPRSAGIGARRERALRDGGDV